MQDCGQQNIDSNRTGANQYISNQGEQKVSSCVHDQRIIKTVMVVMPFHNEATTLKNVVSNIMLAIAQQGLEPRFFLVDDGSTDNSLQIARDLAKNDTRIRYISFSRNFGKEAALMAGIAECGNDFDALAYMDSDGQHTATDLLRMIEEAQNPDIQMVCGVRVTRDYQTPIQRMMAKIFYKIFRSLCNAPIDEGAGDFNVLKPKVVAAMRQMTEEHPFVKGLIGWVGFKRILVPITVENRIGGHAKSSTLRMLKLASGAILSFSSWPLRAWSIIGMSSALLAAFYLCVVMIDTILFGRDIPGYATTVILLLGLGGLQLLSIGIVGEYLARVYDASKQRPRYIIAEKN